MKHAENVFSNPNRPQSNKIQQGEVKKMRQVRLRHRSGSHNYGNEIAARAATPEWRAMGEQCIVVRGSPVRNPGGTPIFWPLPFRGDSLETKKWARELGLTKIFFFFLSPISETENV